MRRVPQPKPWWLGLAVILGFAVAAAAQQSVSPAPPATASPETLRVDTRLVNMLFTVRDARGRLVKNLQREDFTVSDNGQPQPITHFAEELDRPLALALLLDKSTSVEGHFDFQKQATTEFLRTVLRPGTDQALLIAVDKEPHLLVPFTDQVERIERALTPVTPEGGTALFDAARLAIEEHLTQAGHVRKILILVSDGEDTVSWATRGEVLSLALSRNVVVYSLGVKPDGPGRHRRARRNLVRLSDDTGGVALFPKKNPKELSQLFARIADELRHQYSLGYRPPETDSRVFHQVAIKARKKDHRVHARRGYYTEFAQETTAHARTAR
ncbi:MAG: VWA domain-containing protein [Terriglobia bacterium]